MPSIVDRFAAMLSTSGSTITRIADAMRGKGVSPSVDLPSVPHWSAGRPNTNERLANALGLPEAYMGRVSYDAGPSWTRFSSNPATDLTPQKIIGVQQEATSGYPLRWEEMIEQVISRDAHLAGIAQQRVDDVVKGSWRLVRSTPDDVAACVRGFSEEALRQVDSFDDGLAWLLWGNAYCYNATEVIWKPKKISFPGPKGERIGPIEVLAPERLDSVHPKHFRFDLRTDEPLLWLGSDQISLPFGKFVFYKGEGQNPITERRGYMWQCVWLSMFKSIGWAGWTTFVERFGLPTPYVQYGDVAQYNEHKILFNDILQNLGQGFGAMVPNDVKIENLQSPGGGRSSDPHSALSDACDAAQSIRILGATLTAKMGNVGSFAASSTHADVKYAREEADARRLWSSLRSDLLRPLVMFNAEPIARALSLAGYDTTPEEVMARVPRGLHRVPREINPMERMNIANMAVNNLGLKIGQEALFDEFNLPQPMSDQDIAPGQATQISSGGKAIGSVEVSNDGAEAPQKEPLPTGPDEPDDDTEPGKKQPEPKPDQEDQDDTEPPPEMLELLTVNEMRQARGLPPVRGGNKPLDQWKRDRVPGPTVMERTQQATQTLVDLARAGVDVDPGQVMHTYGVPIQATAVDERTARATQLLMDFARAGVEVDPKEVLDSVKVKISAKRMKEEPQK